MSNQQEFRLDSREFGEVYYALVAKALDICPISWESNESSSNSKLHHFFRRAFGDNKSNHGYTNYNKTNFRVDLAARKDEFLGTLSKWFDDVRGHYEDPLVESVDGEKIALIWNRRKGDRDSRNSTDESLKQLAGVCQKKGYKTVLVGTKVSKSKSLGLDFDHAEFQGDYDLNHIQQIAYLLKLIGNRPAFSIGLQSGGMDGLALFGGIPTIFLSTEKTASNGMSELAKRIPNVFRWCEIKYEKKFEKFDKQVLSAIEKNIPNH